VGPFASMAGYNRFDKGMLFYDRNAT